MSNNTVPLTRYDEQENICDTFHLIHSQCAKNLEDLHGRDIFYIWKNTSHLGAHCVLPTGRCPSKIPETFKLELLGCQFFSSHSPQCFLPKVLLFSFAALPLHQNSLLCFTDQPLCIIMLKVTKRVYQ